MDRLELFDSIKAQCGDIIEIFSYKNRDYGADKDAFDNFRKTAQRFTEEGLTEKQGMIKALMILQDKHLVGLSHTLGTGKEDKERFLDVAVYALLARSIMSEGETIKE